MPSTSTAARLRAELLAARQNGSNYPASLKQRVITYAHEARAHGQTWEAISQSLGLSSVTLWRWNRREAEPSSGSFRPVAITDSSAKPSPDATLVLITPNGFRLEGLELKAAEQLLRSLACSA